jgi:hypothetical protein
MISYFRDTYNVALKENQPLFVVHKRDQKIYLPTQYCYEARLPEDFTKDGFLMRTLRDYKISNPNDRYERILKLMNKMGSTQKSTHRPFRVCTVKHRIGFEGDPAKPALVGASELALRNKGARVVRQLPSGSDSGVTPAIWASFTAASGTRRWKALRVRLIFEAFARLAGRRPSS